VADFSSSQRFKRRREPIVPDLVAPGVAVVSARPDGGYQSMDGTSMATPHVAGLAALLMEAVPAADAATIEQAIFASCDPRRTAPGRGNRGLPSGPRALELLV
jgi:subtilisin family serine protease